jgi:beta-glucosidase
VNKKTIVVTHSVGPLILESILALPNVVAVVWAGIPGQESGNGLVDILYGSTSPSGKLPFTIAQKATDYGTSVAPGDDSYTEGLFIDYRHFEKAGITPRYEFGFGLSYTTFAYSNLTVSALSTAAPTEGLAPGGLKSLFDVVATVTASITNNGTVAGAEVAQLYVALPSSAPTGPLKQLRGFDKLSLTAGESGTVTFELRRKDLSYWDVGTKAWVLPTGSFGIMVGASSKDIRLTGTLAG